MDIKSKKCLIAYFSRTGQNYVSGNIKELTVGNTKAVAKMIQAETNGDLFEIEALKSYPTDYTECTKVAQTELNASARPDIINKLDNMENYDVIFIGYPNWWGTCPMPVFTFLEACDFAGKKVIPFCTHEGSGLGHSEADIKRACKGASIVKGIAIHGTNAPSANESIKSWIEKL